MNNSTREYLKLSAGLCLAVFCFAMTAALCHAQTTSAPVNPGQVTFNLPPATGIGAQIMAHVDSALITQIVAGLLAIALAWVSRKNAQHKSLASAALGSIKAVSSTPECKAIGTIIQSGIRAEAQAKGFGPLLTALSPVFHEVITEGVAKMSAGDAIDANLASIQPAQPPAVARILAAGQDPSAISSAAQPPAA